MLSRYIAVATALLAGASASSCDYINGYYYCNNVKQVQYKNVGFSSSYNRVTAMDSNTGSCSSEPFSFSGSLSPLDEELSIHFRGPIQLKQFAAYTRSGSSTRRRDLEADSEEKPVEKRAAGLKAPGIRAREAAAHHHHAKRAVAVVTEVAAVTVWVYVDEHGNTVQTPAATSSSADLSVSAVDKGLNVQKLSSVATSSVITSSSTSTSSTSTTSTTSTSSTSSTSTTSTSTSTTSSSSSSSASSSSSSAAATGAWKRNQYYNAESQSQTGLVFLNHLGGSGSGVFDYKFGNSLSYCAADGSNSASSPQVLSNTVVPSNKEFVMFTDSACGASDCGFYRSGIPAYHGFGGNQKIFLFEFTMPTETTVASGTTNYDMPAIWLLNAQIPRTLQYGDASCSCWTSGCGELDLFEILAAGNTQLTTTIHDKQGGSGAGSADYFTRPTSGTMKAAVIFDGTTITITTLDSSVDFSSALTEDTIEGWISSTSGSVSTVTMG